MRMWLAGSPWRLTGAWLVLAGLVAAAGLRVRQQPLLTIALALLLADPVWGALWQQIAERADRTPSSGRPWHPRLPYADPAGPAGRMFGWRQPGLLPAIVSDVLPIVLLAALVALLLGRQAVVLTASAIALAGLGWLTCRAGLAVWTQGLNALVHAGLPFLLGVSLVTPWPALPLAYWLLGLAAGYALLAWSGLLVLAGAACGAAHLPPSPPRRSIALGLAVVGSCLVVGVLLWAGRPLAAGAAGVLAAAPLFLIARSEPMSGRAIQFWWWLLALGAAAALGLEAG